MSAFDEDVFQPMNSRRKFLPQSQMEYDIYAGFVALQEKGHRSGVVTFVDNGESYAVIGNVFDRALQDKEERNAIVRRIIEQQNSERYGTDRFPNEDGSSSVIHRYKDTLLVLDLSRDFERQWPFTSTVWSPASLRGNFTDTTKMIFSGLDLDGPVRSQPIGAEIIPPEPYGRVEVASYLVIFADNEAHLYLNKKDKIDIYAINENVKSRNALPQLEPK